MCLLLSPGSMLLSTRIFIVCVAMLTPCGWTLLTGCAADLSRQADKRLTPAEATVLAVNERTWSDDFMVLQVVWIHCYDSDCLRHSLENVNVYLRQYKIVYKPGGDYLESLETDFGKQFGEMETTVIFKLTPKYNTQHWSSFLLTVLAVIWCRFYKVGGVGCVSPKTFYWKKFLQEQAGESLIHIHDKKRMKLI